VYLRFVYERVVRVVNGRVNVRMHVIDNISIPMNILDNSMTI
jgi:hypothetical protein